MLGSRCDWDLSKLFMPESRDKINCEQAYDIHMKYFFANGFYLFCIFVYQEAKLYLIIIGNGKSAQFSVELTKWIIVVLHGVSIHSTVVLGRVWIKIPRIIFCNQFQRISNQISKNFQKFCNKRTEITPATNFSPKILMNAQKIVRSNHPMICVKEICKDKHKKETMSFYGKFHLRRLSNWTLL